MAVVIWFNDEVYSGFFSFFFAFCIYNLYNQLLVETHAMHNMRDQNFILKETSL